MWLKQREPDLVEQMDRPDCDPEKLNRTYHQFPQLNRMLTRWGLLYRHYISPLRPAGGEPLTILDIGCGGGDICRKIYRMAKSESIPVRITGIDPDPRAITHARSHSTPSSIRYLTADAGEMVQNGRRFHVVLSNHLLHHLNNSELSMLLSQSDRLATDLVIFNDIRRSCTGLIAFSLFAPLLFRRSFIVEDGLCSIRRSFRLGELQALLPEGWIARRFFPFRLLLIRPKRSEPVRPGLNRPVSYTSVFECTPQTKPGERHE